MTKKSHWNYRVVVNICSITNEKYFAVHEVYYKNGKPISVTKNPITVITESIYDLQSELKKIERALKEPVLWGGHRFPEEYNISIPDKV